MPAAENVNELEAVGVNPLASGRTGFGLQAHGKSSARRTGRHGASADCEVEELEEQGGVPDVERSLRRPLVA